MSVLIKGMEMPKDGAFVEVLIWSDGHVTQTGDSYFAEDGRAYYQPCTWKYFSAIPVPPHGDLIDRVSFREEMDKHYPFDKFTQSKWGEADAAKRTIIMMLADSPTIIPADKEEIE